MLDYCRKRYPKRKVYASQFISYGDYYYYNRKGQLRMVRDGEVYTGAKTGWPYVRPLRKRAADDRADAG